ncbi:MAG: hypothetical protein AAF563_06545 [Pseudomonadota bacterium]
MVGDGRIEITQSKGKRVVTLPIGELPIPKQRLDEELERKAERKVRRVGVTNLFTREDAG